jgi:hypothetical protein
MSYQAREMLHDMEDVDFALDHYPKRHSASEIAARCRAAARNTYSSPPERRLGRQGAARWQRIATLKPRDEAEFLVLWEPNAFLGGGWEWLIEDLSAVRGVLEWRASTR